MANVTNHRQNVTENITGKYFAFIVNLELLISVTVDETVSQLPLDRKLSSDYI